MKRYLAPATTPAVTGRYSLAVLHCASRAVAEPPLTATQRATLASYDGGSPEPFSRVALPRRQRYQGWRVP